MTARRKSMAQTAPATRDRAEPDFVIAFALPNEVTSVHGRCALQFPAVVPAHQAATGIALSWNPTRRSACGPCRRSSAIR